MPIDTIDLTTAPGFVFQTCAHCGMKHKVNLDRGGVDSKPGPFNLPVGATLDVKVDGQATPQTVTFAAGAFPDFAVVTAVQLRDNLNASLVGATAVLNLDGSGVTIESNATGAASKVEVTGGTARSPLGFPTDGIAEPCPGRPVLGRDLGGGLNHRDIICIRRCACGSQEQFLRTWDTCDVKYAGTHLYQHRRAVNALAIHFKAQGWLDAAVAADINAETSSPTDAAAGLPATPIVVPPPLATGGTEGGGA